MSEPLERVVWGGADWSVLSPANIGASAEVGGVDRAVLEAVEALEARYIRDGQATLAYISDAPFRAAEHLEAAVAARFVPVYDEITGARQSMETIHRHILTGDQSQPIPGDVESAARSLFALAGAYESAHRGIDDDYKDQVQDVRRAEQSLLEIEETAGTTIEAMTVLAASHDDSSATGSYIKDHAHTVRADRTEAAHGRAVAGEVFQILDASPAIRDMPDGRATMDYAQDLVSDLQRIGYEGVSPLQLQSDFDKVRERIDQVERAMGVVVAESSQLGRRLETVGAVVDVLRQSPLLREE